MKRLFCLLILGALFAAPGHAEIAERLHASYDPELGWVNKPNVDLPEFYGPRLGFRTNSQGFRNDRDISSQKPEGKRRVLCSGDSFALGYGVNQKDTWCAQLEALDPSIETVNMGQGGYGVDQSYLWFMRDGRRLEYDVHLFTFTFTDFERMKYRDFFGYHKPVLELKDGKLTAQKADPPDPDFKLPKLVQFRIWLHQFEWVQDVEEFARKHFLRVEDERTKPLIRKIFEDLKEESAARHAKLVAVYLPTPFDREPTRLDDLRAFLKEELEQQGIIFLDLTDEFRAMDSETSRRMFLSAEEVKFTGAAGHYSAAGNRLIAERLLPAVE